MEGHHAFCLAAEPCVTGCPSVRFASLFVLAIQAVPCRAGGDGNLVYRRVDTALRQRVGQLCETGR
jgi:hypothetical protein